MATCERELTYSCWDDCKQSGCPTHRAALVFQSTSNSFHFTIGDQDFYLDPHEFQAMVDLTKSLNRADTGVTF